MNIVSRVQGILLSPAKEWTTIKTEKTSVQNLFLGYAAILAAIPAICQFIGWAVFSRWATGRMLGFVIVSYILTLAMTFGIGFVINALAPNFGSKQSLEHAMALAVYSMTPLWVGAILYLIPVYFIYAWVMWLFLLYGLYLLYLGFVAPMLDTPKDKQLTFFIITLILVGVGITLVRVIAQAIFFHFSYSVVGL
jgi:hypothetical protein